MATLAMVLSLGTEQRFRRARCEALAYAMCDYIRRRCVSPRWRALQRCLSHSRDWQRWLHPMPVGPQTLAEPPWLLSQAFALGARPRVWMGGRLRLRGRSTAPPHMGPTTRIDCLFLPRSTMVARLDSWRFACVTKTADSLLLKTALEARGA